MKTSRYRASAAVAALLLVLPTAVQAQSAPVQTPASPPAKSDWTVRLGAGTLYQPKYEGADAHKFVPRPLLIVSYRDLVFLRGPLLGVNAFTVRGARPGDKLQIGPLLRYQFGRDQDDSTDLLGMGDIDGGVEAGGFVTYGIGPFSAGLTIFQDVSGSHDGLTARVSAGHRLPLGPKFTLRSEISTTWADSDYTETFFGVTAAQSARSGMRQYRPGSGVKDAGLTLDLDYKLTDNWGVTGRLGYKRLLGDSADSPLVKDRGAANQFSTGLFLGYSF